uniref:Uncharacterized protein n=1 Tax=viral metagenome TaxID=1070528 RepID=A0A6C0B0M8_9ZZZZ
METLLCESCKSPTFLCKCNNTWKLFNETITTNCGGGTVRIDDSGVSFTPLRISTMTICFNFNQFINLQILKDNSPDFLSVNYKPGSKKSKEKKKKGSDEMFNSLGIKICFVDRSVEPMIFSNVNIFIFFNGKVTVSGVKTINTINIMIQELIEIITSVEGVVENPENLIGENVKIQMICSDFKIKPLKEDPDGWCIKQELLQNVLVNKFNMSATFSSLSRYPGINLKFPSVIEKDKQISLLIFRSGSIIITGAKHAQDLSEGYKFITDTIIKTGMALFYHDINEEIKQKKKKK